MFQQAELADAEIQLSNAPPPAPPPKESHDVNEEKVTPPMETLCTSPSHSIPSPVQLSMVETILTDNQVHHYTVQYIHTCIVYPST